MVGLGCENLTHEQFLRDLGDYDADRVKFLTCQEVEDEFAEAERLLRECAAHASSFVREPIPVSELVIGMKCGGSDGLSGITANPVVGRFSDMMGARGGSTVLTEVPEMFGAEGFLLNRCAGEAVFEKAVNMINGFKNYFISHKETVYDNPSPGNRQGGITTLEDKSCGCVQKGGTAPTLKIASNSRLAEKKKGWIDFDAGPVADGEPVEDAAGRLLQLVIQVAGGQKTRTEELGFREISIFKEGITL